MARKRKEIVFKVTNIFPKDGLTWDELTESIFPLIEQTLNYFQALEKYKDPEKAMIAAKDMKCVCVERKRDENYTGQLRRRSDFLPVRKI